MNNDLNKDLGNKTESTMESEQDLVRKQEQENERKEQQRDSILNLLLDIILPVIILNQLSKRLGADGPLIALIAALSLPIGHGLYDVIVKKKKNMFSILGVVNILLTGGLALLKLEGFWFAVKEAAFPLVIGIAVFWSAFTEKPFVKMILFNNNIVKLDLINNKLSELGHHSEFKNHLKVLTMLLAGSFLFSAILNYGLARYIFVEIPKTLPELEQSVILNAQIAKMTWLSFIVIALPSLVLTVGIFWYMLKGVKRYTGLEFNDIFQGMDA